LCGRFHSPARCPCLSARLRLADLLDELPVLVEQDHPIVAVAVGHNHVAVVQDRDAGRQVQVRGVVSFFVGRAELQQELIELRTEFDDAVRVALDDIDVAVQSTPPECCHDGLIVLPLIS